MERNRDATFEVSFTRAGLSLGTPRRFSLREAGVPLTSAIDPLVTEGLDGEGFDLIVRCDNREALIPPGLQSRMALAEALRKVAGDGELAGKRFTADVTGESTGAAGGSTGASRG